MSIKVFRFQLRTKPGAERTLRRFAGSCRWVWNAAIAEQQRRREAGEKFSNYVAMAKWLTAWRHAPETAWLAEAPIHPLQQTLRRLEAAYQRAVSRKVKGSSNRRKAVDRLGRLHARIAAQRNDWLHKLSTRLADSHPVIAIEDLRVAAISTSAACTSEAPGKQVRQKAGLNRAILDQGWAEFRRQLKYKCVARGGTVMPVNPAYTSQRCRYCGHVSPDNRQTQSVFACVACGHTENADTNAAKNILAAGLAVWSCGTAACGEDVRRAKPARAKRAAALKQEPAEEWVHV